MTLRIITPPAVEPVSISDVMQWGRISSTAQEPSPGVITATLASPAVAGNVDNGAHRYLATFTTSSGETQAGVVSASVTVADKTVNGKVSLTAIPLGGSNVTSRKLYRTAAGGSTYLLLATLADNTTTVYTDNIADASLGAGAPTANTTTDPMLGMLISGARQVAEDRTGRALITQTWEALYDAFPSNELRIGMLPIQSISSVKYLDSDGVLQTVASTDYVLDADTLPGWVRLAHEKSWPSTRAIENAVIVRFVAGYGAAAAVPSPLRMWIAAQVAASFRNPDALLEGNAQPMPFLDHLLDTFSIRMMA